MEKSTFVYVTYIRTTPEKLWQALTEPEFTRQFFFGMVMETDWQVGSAWKTVGSDGEVKDSGEIIEIDPPRRLVLKWRNEFKPEMKAEGDSRMTYELEQQGEMVKFTVLHEMDKGESKLIRAVSNGWPMILSSLKSLLETGESLEETRTS
ncbi:MAG: SRPBCC family protein [Verrucomicrobiota bacterium]|nr:SRPBCC family protein [Verrucomicrobiota bacterium]